MLALSALALTLFPFLVHSLVTLDLPDHQNTTLAAPSPFHQCLQQYPPDHDQVPTASYHNCTLIILGFSTGLALNAPAVFSRETWTGVRLPVKGVHEDCVFEIDMASGGRKGDEDRASTMEVRKEASRLAMNCVKEKPWTGGLAWVGEKTELEIILRGSTGRMDRVDGVRGVEEGWVKVVGGVCGDEVDGKVSTPLGSIGEKKKRMDVERCARECEGFRYLGVKDGKL